MRLTIIFTLVSVFSFLVTTGQDKVSFSGIVKNDLTLQPAIGVVVILSDESGSSRTITDDQGYFRFENVAHGRYLLTAQSVEFEPHQQELLVTSGGLRGININLKSSVLQLDTITVEASPTRRQGFNTTEFTIEQTLRFPATFFDPARAFIGSTPGVIVQNDQNNNIIVNGKSPNYVKWILEGANILNPNHLSNAGTLSDRPTQAGGGVNIFSAQMLGSTQFIQPPYNAYYGNASSGILQMSLREGSREDRFVAQASLLGLDMASEGAIGEKTTFLVNGRYSTVGLLTELGLDFGGEQINFYDAAFSIDHQFDNGGSLKLFGFGGYSRNKFEAPDDPADWEEDKDSTNVDFDNEISGIGARVDLPIKNGKVSITSIFSDLDSKREVDAICGDGCSELVQGYYSKDRLLSSRFHISKLLNSWLTVHTGAIIDYKDIQIVANELIFNPLSQQSSVINLVDTHEEYWLLNPYINAEAQLSKLLIDVGIRFNYSTLNQDLLYEPRLSLTYQMSEKGELNLGYDRQYQYQLPDLFLSPDTNLKPTQVDNFELGTRHYFSRSVITNRLFYSIYDDIPFLLDDTEFNRLNEFPDIQRNGLGMADVYGYNLMVQQSFVNNFYFVSSLALFNSVTSSDEDDSRYNGNYSFSFTSGKEYKKEKSGRQRFFCINGRAIYAGGLRERPVDISRSQEFRRTVYAADRGYENQLTDYFRIDLRLSWRKEGSNSTRTLALDIQNLFSTENDAWSYYDFRKGRVVRETQLGIIPILVYRVEF